MKIPLLPFASSVMLTGLLVVACAHDHTPSHTTVIHHDDDDDHDGHHAIRPKVRVTPRKTIRMTAPATTAIPKYDPSAKPLITSIPNPKPRKRRS